MTTDAIDAPYVETTALAVREQAAPPVAWTPRFVLPIEEMVQASNDMTEFQRRIMVNGEHYGVIPGTDKPTLLKPGAELLLSRMALHAADPTILSETIDYGECDNDGNVTKEGLIRFSLQVNIYHQTGATENERVLVGSGIGACTSREKKYRWRDGSPTCPACGKGLRMSKNKPEWYCWAKLGGCSATFPKNDFEQVGRVFNPDLADLENTIFKMAKKRALIDATLVATGCSNVFTQDIGDDGLGDPKPPDPDDLAEQYANRPPTTATDPDPSRGANSESAGTGRPGFTATAQNATPAGGPPPGLVRVQTEVLLDLANSLGIGSFAEWAATNVPGAHDLAERKPRRLTIAESIEAKRQLEALIPGADYQAPPPQTPRPGRVFIEPSGGNVTPAPDAEAKKRRALRTSIHVSAKILWPDKVRCEEERHRAERLHRVAGLSDDVLDNVNMEALESLQRDLARRADGTAVDPDEMDDALAMYAEGKL